MRIYHILGLYIHITYWHANTHSHARTDTHTHAHTDTHTHEYTHTHTQRHTLHDTLKKFGRISNQKVFCVDVSMIEIRISDVLKN